MRKRILIIMLLFICIVGTVAIFIISQRKSTNDFPHAKQYAIKMKGTQSFLKGQESNVKLEFLDEKYISEMSSKDNFKSIQLIDSSNKRYQLKDWSLDKAALIENSLYKVQINSKIALDQASIIEINKVEIVFSDGLKKTFDIGNLNFNVMGNNDVETTYIDYQNQFIESPNSRFPGGWHLNINNKYDSKDITLEDVQTGANGINVDSKSVKILKNMDDVDAYNYANSKGILNDFQSPLPSIKNNAFNPILLKNEKKLNNYTSMFFKLAYDQSVLKDDANYFLDFVYYIKVPGESKIKKLSKALGASIIHFYDKEKNDYYVNLLKEHGQ